ncbi:MAG: hypothetical protein ACFB9N_14325 [Geitlerinemataceae cyanobacterium]
MSEVSLNWKPDAETLHGLMQIAVDRHCSLESVLEEAIAMYLDEQLSSPLPPESDPMVGLFSGSPDLSEQTEEILEAGAIEEAGVPCQG